MMNSDGSSAGRRRVPERTSKDPIRHAVEVIVEGFRKAGITDSASIRLEILDCAKEALDTKEPLIHWVEVDGQPAPLIDPAGLLNLAFRAIGADHQDQRVQETLFGRIERALTEVLADS